MAISVRQFLSSGSNTAALSAALGSSTAIGDTVYVIHLDNFYTAAGLTAPTSANLTFVQQGTTIDFGTNKGHLKVWAAPVTVGGAQTVAANSTNIDQERVMFTFVLTNALTTADVVGNGGSASGATALSIPAISPVGTTDLLIAVWGAIYTSAVGVTLTGFTAGLTQQGATIDPSSAHFHYAACATKTLAASGTTGAQQCTASVSTTNGWTGVLIAVKESGGAASVSVPRRPQRGPNYRR